MRFSIKLPTLVLVLLLTQAANAQWTKINSKTFSWLQAIFFLDAHKGFIGGSNGAFLTTRDGGESWAATEKFTKDAIRKIHFTDLENGWLLCERDQFNLGANAPSYLLHTKDGGKTFERFEFDGLKRERISDIFFSKYGMGFAIGESGAMFVMQDDRKNWRKHPAPIHFLMLGGQFQSTTDGTLVGGGGNILFSEDSGFSWQKATVATNPKTRFNAVFYLDDKKGWAVGTDGKIFHTINGGKMWRSQTSGVTEELNDAAFFDSAEGFAIGTNGTILFTATGGNVWTPMPSHTTHKLETIAIVDQKAFVVGYGGTILKYQKDKNPMNEKPRLKN